LASWIRISGLLLHDPKEIFTDPQHWLLEGKAHRFDEAGDESTEGGDLVLQVGAVFRQLLQLLVLFLIKEISL
jgi:hypothetical protein